jgi:hypothetical protein
MPLHDRDRHTKPAAYSDKGTRGFRTIAIVFVGVLAVLLLAGIWATSEIGENKGPRPTASTPK